MFAPGFWAADYFSPGYWSDDAAAVAPGAMAAAIVAGATVTAAGVADSAAVVPLPIVPPVIGGGGFGSIGFPILGLQPFGKRRNIAAAIEGGAAITATLQATAAPSATLAGQAGVTATGQTRRNMVPLDNQVWLLAA